MNAHFARMLLCFGILCGLSSAISAAVVYDATDDFSLASNPNGVWTYGTTGTTLTGALSPFVSTDTGLAGISNWDGWEGTQAMFRDHYPFVAKYTGATNGMSSNIVLLPNTLTVHPAPNGEYAVARFTAPSDGDYLLNAVFEGRETSNTRSDVHILQNGVSLFDAEVSGFGPSSDQAFATTVSLNAGDYLDFSAGYGSNSSFLADTLSLSATITSIPEPRAWQLTVIALVAVAANGIRKR